MAEDRYSHSAAELSAIAAQVLDYARAAGATACETEVSIGFGQTVTARLGDVETIEYTRDKGLGVTVYVGRQRGHAGTSDFSADALKQTAEAAVAIARHTAADDCAGLADRELLAVDPPDLDLHHPWDLPVERAIELAKEAEAAAMAVDPRINNSDGATVSVHESRFVYANSLGFSGGYPTSRHSVSCAVIGGEGDAMQRDYWYSSGRVPGELEQAAAVGRRAGERTAQRLGARKIATAEVPVVFEAPVAASLIGHFVHAVSGGSLYRKASFLVDSLGKAVFSEAVTLRERPHLPRALASAPFDDEGVATRERDVVTAGTLNGYFLGSYSARKLKMRTTANAGGNHNLLLEPGPLDLPGLLREMGTGLLVTELLGHGVNTVTGDYSRGAAGFWVESGAIAYPVQEITIAGNLADMFKRIVAVGSDVVARGSKRCGSILIERMTIAGD